MEGAEKAHQLDGVVTRITEQVTFIVIDTAPGGGSTQGKVIYRWLGRYKKGNRAQNSKERVTPLPKVARKSFLLFGI